MQGGSSSRKDEKAKQACHRSNDALEFEVNEHQNASSFRERHFGSPGTHDAFTEKRSHGLERWLGQKSYQDPWTSLRVESAHTTQSPHTAYNQDWAEKNQNVGSADRRSSSHGLQGKSSQDYSDVQGSAEGSRARGGNA